MNKMRIILHNPHADDFIGAPVSYFLFRKKALKKYYYLLDGVRHQGSQFVVYADGYSSSLLPNQFFSLGYLTSLENLSFGSSYYFG